jgi:hypothetical protein
MEADFAFRGFGFEIRGDIANLQRHGKTSVTCADPMRGSMFGNLLLHYYVRFKCRQY